MGEITSRPEEEKRKYSVGNGKSLISMVFETWIHVLKQFLDM